MKKLTNISKIKWAFLVSLFMHLDGVNAKDFMCPREILVDKQKLAQDIAGWETFYDTVNTKHILTQITFYDGAPKEMVSLVPDNEGKNQRYNIWSFVKGNTRLYWYACAYSNTSIQLARSIDKNIHTCRVDYEKGFKQILSVSCK